MLKSEEKIFKDVVKSQVMNHDCGSSKEDEKPTAIESHEIPQKTDDGVLMSDIAQKRQNGRKRPKSCLLKGKKYLCAPLFWIRFVCSFFVMAKEIKEVYRSFGYETFEDLISLSSKDIGLLVRKMQETEGIDAWTVGECEEELVSYCHSKNRFLKEHSATDLRRFISSNNDFEGLRNDKEMAIIDLAEHPRLRESFQSEDGSLPEASNLVLSYLERFGVHDFSFLGEEILGKEICCYGLSNEDEKLRFLLKPYKVVSLLCFEFMERGEGNAFGIDEELRLLSYYDHYLRPSFDHFADKRHWKSERDYEITVLLDGGKFTLEELGQRYGRSRERIRQIGLLSMRRAYPCLHILDKLVSYKGWVPLSFFFGTVPGLITLIKKYRSKNCCCYLDDLDVVISGIEVDLIEKDESFAVRRGYCVCRRDIEAFYEKHGFSLYPWLNANSYRVDFSPYPSFAFRRMGMKDVARQYLFSKGSCGFNSITDKEDATRFFRSVLSLPNEKPISWRSIVGAILQSGCIRRSSRVYINPSFVKDKQIEIVRSVLSETSFGRRSVPGSLIFELNKPRLLSYDIDNKYFFRYCLFLSRRCL